MGSEGSKLFNIRQEFLWTFTNHNFIKIEFGLSISFNEFDVHSLWGIIWMNVQKELEAW